MHQILFMAKMLMGRWMITVTFVFLFSMIPLLLVSCQRAPLPITVYTGEWSPFTSKLPNPISVGAGGAYGLAADIVTATLREMGYEPRYEFRQWDVVEDGIKEENILHAFPFGKAASRKGYFCYSNALIGTEDPEISATLVLYYNNEHLDGKAVQEILDALLFNKQDPDKNKIKVIPDKYIGMVKGYEYDKSIAKTFANIKNNISDEIVAFKMLIEGEILLLPSHNRVGDNILKRYFLNDIHTIDMIKGFEIPQALYFVIPGKSENCGDEFMTKFNAKLESVKKKGIYSAIKNRYEIYFPLRPVRSQVIRLIAVPGYPLIFGSSRRDTNILVKETSRFLIPHGTRAVVVEWNDRFEHAGHFTIDEAIHAKTQVRILEGPLKASVLWVPNVFISMGQQ